MSDFMGDKSKRVLICVKDEMAVTVCLCDECMKSNEMTELTQAGKNMRRMQLTDQRLDELEKRMRKAEGRLNQVID